ncbi:uncharacterized protein BO97DRAFT_224298 [Aspergillus homomorphus CBS 101889]|uniref:Uncharacterized protein n=1 Tax=Aspergillus homomorphus (strain CBS 101889) TaxID=1450537 RepID=A0A395HKM3_ASPHC|nr:hypothetical protein BO97DRAFT_224298 [Aspergillus homomorphus CBS 101889]RAL08290.1 hypothetical protein BO97DRAFT_224298 [Aspergillus homomorphus CBS 101889]
MPSLCNRFRFFPRSPKGDKSLDHGCHQHCEINETNSSKILLLRRMRFLPSSPDPSSTEATLPTTLPLTGTTALAWKTIPTRHEMTSGGLAFSGAQTDTANRRPVSGGSTAGSIEPVGPTCLEMGCQGASAIQIFSALVACCLGLAFPGTLFGSLLKVASISLSFAQAYPLCLVLSLVTTLDFLSFSLLYP